MSNPGTSAGDWKRAGLAQALGAADQRLDALRQQSGVDDAAAFRMAAVGSAADDWESGALRRRGRRSLGVNDAASLHLVSNEDGFLEWDFGPASAQSRGQRRRSRRTTSGSPAGIAGVVEQSYVVRRIAPNAVTAAIRGIDAVLNGNHGLRELDGNNQFTGEVVTPRGKKKRLLIIHGTFSSTKGMLGSAPTTFWAWARANYDEVLGFDHPSLCVGPVMNAFDVAQSLRDAEGPLDVIAHSRGGLVARWLLEGFGAGRCTPCRAVLVGAPLDGTSLAAPFKLQRSLSMLSNVGVALRGGNTQDAEVGQSFFDAALGLAGVVASAANTQGLSLAADAVVAVIPGLLSMARVAGNADIDRLAKATLKVRPTYHAISSNYVSESPLGSISGFFSPKTWAGKAVDSAIDGIFPGENDLVVDTESMTLLDNTVQPPLLITHSHRFRESQQVHHLNYFAQKETREALHDWLR